MMSFFDDDPFDEIVREFFSPSISRSKIRKSNIIMGEEEDRNIDFIENDDYVYLIFELPGYSERDVDISIINRDLEIKASKKNCEIEKVRDYLSQKLCKGEYIRKTLPKFIETKGFKYNVKNGILEIKFIKK